MLVPEGAKAGKINKPCGLRGEVYLILESQAGENIKTDNPLFIEIDGQRVPFFVEEVELISKDQAIVKFEFIDTLESARKFSGCYLYFDMGYQPAAAAEQEDLSNLIGYKASDRKSGHLGLISDYFAHPMNPVFVIQTRKSELMVPAVRDFINRIDHKERHIHFILPEGLTDL